MHIAKRIMALCLSLLILMMTTAQAELPFLVHSEEWNWEAAPVEVLLKADVNTHMPFDDDRLAMLTPILDMLSMRLVTGPDEGLVTIAVADQDVLTLQYRGNEVQLSSRPDLTYLAVEDPLNMLLGAEASFKGGYETLGLARDGESFLTDGRILLANLPEEMEAYGKKTANTTNIAGFGKSAYRYDYAVPANKSDELREILLSNCPEGRLHELLEGLTFSGKHTFRIYFNEKDELLRAEYNGSCGSEDDLRTVKLIYKQSRNETTEKDYVELTSPAKKGKNKNSLTFERTVETDDKGTRVIEGNYNYTVTSDGVTSIRKGEFSLKNAFAEGGDHVTGSVTFQSRLNGAEEYESIMFAPELSVTGTAAEPCLSGRLEITGEYAGRTTEHAVISIDLHPAGALAWEERPETIDLAALEAQALAEVRQEAAASIVTAIVHPLIVMMGEESEWFFRELPAEAVDAIIEAAEMPVY